MTTVHTDLAKGEALPPFSICCAAEMCSSEELAEEKVAMSIIQESSYCYCSQKKVGWLQNMYYSFLELPGGFFHMKLLRMHI